tara:strand:- start:53 stop:481 length:429 start_codon:yes stop_codon:yes gene_type:complete
MSDLEQKVQALCREITPPDCLTKLKWEVEVDEDIPEATDGYLAEYHHWDDVRDHMYAKYRDEEQMHRKELRDLLSDYFGGKPPNLKASRLKKILGLYGIREKMPVWDCVKAILFYSVVISGMILLFGGLCYVMHGISRYPGW